jgi:hypothetical protein
MRGGPEPVVAEGSIWPFVVGVTLVAWIFWITRR